MQGGAVAEDSGAGSGTSTPAAQVVEAKSANKKGKKKGKGGKW
jgi:signal recognition particle subunit SRP72